MHVRKQVTQDPQKEEGQQEEDIYGGVGQPDHDADGGDDIYGGVGGHAPDQSAGAYNEEEEEDLYNDIVPGLAQVDGVSDIFDTVPCAVRSLGGVQNLHASMCAG